MLILLLASAFALSFAPLTQNEPSTTVAVGEITFDPVTLVLTISINSTSDGSASDSDFRVAVYDVDTEGTVLFDAPIAKELLNAEPHDVTVSLNNPEKLHNLKTLYVDVLEDDGENPEMSILSAASRPTIVFGAAATGVTLEEVDADNVKVIFTLDATLGAAAGLKFVWDGAEIGVDEVEGETTKYSVTMAKTELTDSASPYGFFKGADASKSTLSIWVPNEAAPALVLAYLNTEKVKGTLTNTNSRKVYIKTGDSDEVELTKEPTADYYEIPYTAFAEGALVYFKNENDVVTSLKQKITALSEINPTPAWVAGSAGQPPKLEVEFAEDSYNDKILALYRGSTKVDDQTIAAKKVEFTLADLAGEDMAVVLVDGSDHVESKPKALSVAGFSFENGTLDTEKLPVIVTMTAGTFAKVPAGLVVYVEGETDWSEAKFYPFTWDAETAGKATADVLLDDWTEVTNKNVIAYVTETQSDPIAAEPVKLSEETFTVFQRGALDVKLSYHNGTHFKVTLNIPPQHTAWIKTGTTELEIKDAIEGGGYAVPCTAFAADSKVYLKDDAGAKVGGEAEIEAIPDLPAPAWVISADAEKTRLLQIEFADDTFDGTTIKLIRPEEDDVSKPVTSKKVQFTMDELHGTSAVLAHVGAENAPMSIPKILAKAVFTLKNGTGTAEKQPIEVEMGVGVVEAIPGSLLVTVKDETDWKENGKVYDLAWDVTTANKLTGEVTIADWKDKKKEKEIQAFVTDKIEDDTEDPVKLSGAFVVFPKDEPKKEDGAFSSIVSLMAVFVSLLVFAL